MNDHSDNHPVTHTKGPWLCWDDGRTIGIEDGKGESIAIMEIVDHGDMADDMQLRADQALAASAPDLLAQLRIMTSLYENLQGHETAGSRRAKAVIVQATTIQSTSGNSWLESNIIRGRIEKAQVVSQVDIGEATITVIRHWADDHDPQEAAAVIAPSDIDVRRAAVYVQFLAERCFGRGTTLHNKTIAAALIKFYGCSGAIAPEDAYKRNWREPGVVDLYWHREFRWDGGDDILEDASLHRKGLEGFIRTRGSHHS